MRFLRWLILGGAAVWTVPCVLAIARPATAVPAWGRKYALDCVACHNAGFRLNRMGQDFLRSGHAIQDDEAKADLSDHVSVAQKVRFTQSQAEYDDGTIVSQKNTFEQHALSLYMGGHLDGDFYYFAELYWHENSGKTSGASDFDDFARSKLADAYIQYLRRYQGEEQSYTSVRFGQFTPYLLHLHGVGARLSQDRPYVINSGTVGDNPYKPFARQYGLEVAQHYAGFTATAAAVNGTGGKAFNRVDNDLRKDYWGTLDYAFDQRGSMLGVYGYFGQYPLHRELPAVYKSRDEFNQLGVLGNLTLNQGAVVGALFAGQNEFAKEAAFPVDSTREVKSLGYYTELQVYATHPRVQAYLRWDFWDPDTDLDDNEVSGPLLGISWRALDHGRLVGHVQELKTKNVNPALEKTEQSLVIEANWMF